MKVFVYMNLHATRRAGKPVYSVKALSGPSKGRVIARESSVLVQSASGKVSEAGRQRVLREGRKNVHAGIVGRLFAVGDAAERYLGLCKDGWVPITYNPRKYENFVHKDDESAFGGAGLVFLGEKGVAAKE